MSNNKKKSNFVAVAHAAEQPQFFKKTGRLLNFHHNNAYGDLRLMSNFNLQTALSIFFQDAALPSCPHGVNSHFGQVR